jgi:hypothetical protein
MIKNNPRKELGMTIMLELHNSVARALRFPLAEQLTS